MDGSLDQFPHTLPQEENASSLTWKNPSKSTPAEALMTADGLTCYLSRGLKSFSLNPDIILPIVN